jgi:FeS assembly SUF system protein
MSELKDKVIDALKTCYDPEITINIYDLGLIYEIEVDRGAVSIRMTLTAPNCPVAGSLPGEVERKVRRVPGVTDTKVELVWDPPWDRSRLSRAATGQSSQTLNPVVSKVLVRRGKQPRRCSNANIHSASQRSFVGRRQVGFPLI